MKGSRTLQCMDDAHHDPIHFHRVYSLQAVERPPQPPGSDDGKPGDDDGNPYTPALSSLASRRISANEASVRPSRQTLREARGDKRPAIIPGLAWEKSSLAHGPGTPYHHAVPQHILIRPDDGEAVAAT